MSKRGSARNVDRLVVGVDGSDAALVAVRYAAAEARRTGATLELVHAAPELGPFGFGVTLAYQTSGAEHRAVGIRLLNVARIAAREVAGARWPVLTTVLDGSAVPALSSAAEGALAVVLGDQRRTLADRLFTGSVATGLCAHASAPVVIVPETWSTDRPVRDVVAVAVRDPEGSEDLLRHAFRIAAERSSRLCVVHAWELPMPYDDLVVTRPGTDAWPADSREVFERVLERVRAEHPQVEADLRLVHGQPARVLQHISGSVDLLLLASRRHAFRAGHLGATGHAVLREARCPIQVVTLHAEDLPGGDAVQSAGLDPELVR